MSFTSPVEVETFASHDHLSAPRNNCIIVVQPKSLTVQRIPRGPVLNQLSPLLPSRCGSMGTPRVSPLSRVVLGVNRRVDTQVGHGRVSYEGWSKSPYTSVDSIHTSEEEGKHKRPRPTLCTFDSTCEKGKEAR